MSPPARTNTLLERLHLSFRGPGRLSTSTQMTAFLRSFESWKSREVVLLGAFRSSVAVSPAGAPVCSSVLSTGGTSRPLGRTVADSRVRIPFSVTIFMACSPQSMPAGSLLLRLRPVF